MTGVQPVAAPSPGLTRSPSGAPYRVLVFEPDHLGHRLSTVRTLVDALLAVRADAARPLQMTLAVDADAGQSAEYAQQLESVRWAFDQVLTAPLPQRRAPHEIAAAKAAALSTVLASASYDHVYVPYGDGLVQWLGLTRFGTAARQLGSLTAEAVLMRNPASVDRGRLRAWVNLCSLRAAPFARQMMIDPVAFAALTAYPRALCRHFALIPDPTPAEAGMDRCDARRALGLVEAGRYIGCVGYQDERKGIPTLIEAFLGLETPNDVRLLLAGRQSPAVRQLLAGVTDQRVVTLDRYLSESELRCAVSALDLMVTPYAGFDGSASLCIRAAGAGRKVLAGNTGWMGAIVPEFDLGWTCDAQDAGSLRSAMARHLDEAVIYKVDTRQSPFCRYHQPANVAAHLTALIRERLFAPGGSTALSWPGRLTASPPR